MCEMPLMAIFPHGKKYINKKHRKCGEKMDIATISIIIAVVSCLIGLAGWLLNRDNKTDKDAEWKGTVNAKLDTIISLNAEVSSAKNKIQDHETRITILEKYNEKRS